MDATKWREWLTKEVLIGYCIITGLIAVAVVFGYIRYKNHVIDRIQATARTSVVQGGQAIEAELGDVERTASELASHIRQGSISTYEHKIKEYMKATKAVVSIGYVRKDSQEIVAYQQRSPDHPIKEIKKLTYQELAKQHKWKATVFEQPGWNETFLRPGFNYTLVDYTVPIRRPGQKTANALLYITYSTEILTDHVLSIQLGKAGYSFVLLPHGKFIIHPIRNYVLEGKTVFEHAQAEEDPGLLELSKRLKTHKDGEINYTNKKTGRRAWIIYRSLDKTEWVLAGIFFLNELYREVEAPLRHYFIFVLLALLFFFIGLTALLVRAYTGQTRSLWHFAIIVSLFFSIIIGMLWHITTQRTFIPLNKVLLVDKPALHDYIHEITMLRNQRHLSNAITIPTGVFIQQAQFTSDNNVNVSGIIWQRYKKGEHDHLQRGFFFPDAWGGNNDIEQVYHITTEDEEIIGWKFASILMQSLNPKRYPLDATYIKTRIWHVDFEKNVILKPDLAAYSFTNPLLLPGLDPAVKFGAWDLRRSFFSYTLSDYRTTFGVPEASVFDVFPELTFNIGVQRKVFNVLISILFPLLGAAFMLFASLLAFTETPGDMARRSAKSSLTR